MEILKIKNLSVEYYRGERTVFAVRDLDLELKKGRTLALVGESGCGKSTLAMSVLRLIFPEDGRITYGEILFEGKDILKLDDEELRKMRGREISMVLQDPFLSLNPVLTVKEQLCEMLDAHQKGLGEAEKTERAAHSLSEVMFTDTKRILGSYPHQLSGGQRQRVALAIATINRPAILIADEPTTALDVTIQKEIMDLMQKLKEELDLTLLLITHNLPLAGERADDIAVMYAGEIIEKGSARNIFTDPKHPYTAGLMRSVQKLNSKELFALEGQPPDLSEITRSCKFLPRCGRKMKICEDYEPRDYNPGASTVKCFLYKERP